MAATVAARWLTDPWLGSQIPIGLLFGTVAFAVWYARPRAGYRGSGIRLLGFLRTTSASPRRTVLRHGRGRVALVVYVLSCDDYRPRTDDARCSSDGPKSAAGGVEANRSVWKSRRPTTVARRQRSASERAGVRAEELEAVVDVLPVGIFLADDRTLHIDSAPIRPVRQCSASGLNRTRLSRAPAAEQLPFRVVRDGADVAAEDLPMQRATRTGQAVHGEEYDIVHSDGSESRLMNTPHRFTTSDAGCGCVGAFVDITAPGGPRNREDAARSASGHHQRGSRTHFLHRLWYRYQLANDAYRTWFGLDPDEIRGRHVSEVLGHAAWDAVRPHMQRALAGEVVNYEQELPLYHRAGPRWVLATYTPDRDASERVRGFVVLVTDIGEPPASRRGSPPVEPAARTSD